MEPTLHPDNLRSYEAARLSIAKLNVSPEQPLEEVLRLICQTSAAALEVARVGLWFFSTDGKSLRCSLLHEHTTRSQSEGVTLQVVDFPAYFAAMATRRSISAEYAQQDPRTAQLAAAYLTPLGITSMLDAPIYQDGQVIGVICHEHVGSPREWSTEQRDFASSIADLVALKLKAADIHELRTLLRQTDEQLDAAEKAETIARIAAGAAHDFNNFLCVIMGMAHQLKTQLLTAKEVRETADTILLACDRGASLVRAMTTLGQTQPDSPIVFNPVECLRSCYSLLSTAVGKSCDVILDLETASGRVFLDPRSLERAVLNLVINARDAMPNGGKITVRLNNDRPDRSDHRSLRYVHLSVSDTGTGIPEDLRERVFEPYFTTKRSDEGTGLGLAIVKKIVERAGGTIRVESMIGKGSQFHLYFPTVSME